MWGFYQVGVAGQAFFVESEEAVGFVLADGAVLDAVDEESRILPALESQRLRVSVGIQFDRQCQAL